MPRPPLAVSLPTVPRCLSSCLRAFIIDYYYSNASRRNSRPLCSGRTLSKTPPKRSSGSAFAPDCTPVCCFRLRQCARTATATRRNDCDCSTKRHTHARMRACTMRSSSLRLALLACKSVVEPRDQLDERATGRSESATPRITGLKMTMSKVQERAMHAQNMATLYEKHR